MKKAIPIAVVLVTLCVVVYFFRIRPARKIDPVVRGSGSIEATEVVIAAKIPARIVTIAVDEGDEVTRGQQLAQLDCADLEVREAQAQAQLAQAQAARVQAATAEKQARSAVAPVQTQAELARKEQARAQRLFASAGVTQRTLDQATAALQGTEEQLRAAELGVHVAKSQIAVATAQVELAEKSLALARTQLGECTLTAPMAGVVMTRVREPGELVLPGSTLLELGRLDEVHTWIYVPNEEIGRVRVGQTAELVADTYPDKTFRGTVVRINDKAEFTPKSIQTKEDRTRLVFGVKVAIANPERELLPGMPVEAALVEGDTTPASS